MNKFRKEAVFSWFTNNKSPCNKGLGLKIKNCQEFKDRMQKELSGPGCSSCRMKSVYQKYKSLVFQNIIYDEDSSNE